jgi:hypothetical protein
MFTEAFEAEAERANAQQVGEWSRKQWRMTRNWSETYVNEAFSLFLQLSHQKQPFLTIFEHRQRFMMAISFQAASRKPSLFDNEIKIESLGPESTKEDKTWQNNGDVFEELLQSSGRMLTNIYGPS